jgi:hypothetical protein
MPQDIGSTGSFAELARVPNLSVFRRCAPDHGTVSRTMVQPSHTSPARPPEARAEVGKSGGRGAAMMRRMPSAGLRTAHSGRALVEARADDRPGRPWATTMSGRSGTRFRLRSLVFSLTSRFTFSRGGPASAEVPTLSLASRRAFFVSTRTEALRRLSPALTEAARPLACR